VVDRHLPHVPCLPAVHMLAYCHHAHLQLRLGVAPGDWRATCCYLLDTCSYTGPREAVPSSYFTWHTHISARWYGYVHAQ
jgi:hypothetical protein